MVYRSPWIVQLKRLRLIQRLITQVHPDTVIIGGGIAGIATAYFILHHTKNTVLVLEADQVAHGATGHNAGQVVSYFERPLHHIATEYGKTLAIEAHQDLIQAWDLLETLSATAHLRTPITQFTGYAGYSTLAQVISQLQTIHLLHESKNKTEPLLLAKEAEVLDKIPMTYHPYCNITTRKEIMHVLDTTDYQYIAAFPERKGCTNSSLLSEELVGYLLSTYPERFQLAEDTAAKQITLTPTEARIKTAEQSITTSTVVLCTNGYTTYEIHSASPNPPFSPPHIQATVGYMNGYFDRTLRPAAANQYFTEHTRGSTDPYYYITRRLYEHGRHAHTLLCIGGPELTLPDGQPYVTHAHYLPDAQRQLNQFVLSTYPSLPPQGKPDFQWHGLMGYTSNMIRLIGPDPIYPALCYNLGCNGVGILPSIYGGKRIAHHLAGDRLPPSIFDPIPYTEQR